MTPPAVPTPGGPADHAEGYRVPAGDGEALRGAGRAGGQRPVVVVDRAAARILDRWLTAGLRRAEAAGEVPSRAEAFVLGAVLRLARATVDDTPAVASGPVCAQCGQPLCPAGHGRRPYYCSPRCRKRAQRGRYS
jgi:hypothetical protein